MMSKLNKNKKGFFPGWQYPAAFFILAIIFLFYVGFYDFFKVELFEPTSDLLIENIELLTNQTNITNPTIAAMYENADRTMSLTADFNLLFIFLFTFYVAISLIAVSRISKGSVTTFFFHTVGGIMYLFFIVQLALFKVLEWLRVDFIEYIFGDIVFNLIPFYQLILDNWGVTLLIWSGALILSNWLFGKERATTSARFTT